MAGDVPPSAMNDAGVRTNVPAITYEFGGANVLTITSVELTLDYQ